MPHEQIYRPPKRKWLLPRERWPGCARLSRLLPVVVMLTIALCFSSCATTKKTQMQQEQTFSTSEKSDTTASVTRVITTQTVPESRVNLAVSVDSLLRLPEGAAYRRSNERAHVEASQKGGVIYITGTCDSLQRQVEYYEALYHTARDALEQTEQSLLQEQQKKISTTPWWVDLALLMVGYAVGVAATIFVTKDKLFKKQ